MRTYLEGLLKEEYLVQTCSNGRDALLVAREYNPDLILSDVMMPEMGGDELCASVKSDIETSHIPVMLLTALGDEKDMLEGLENGADAYITKPFSITCSGRISGTYWQTGHCSNGHTPVLRTESDRFRRTATIPGTGNSWPP